MVAREVAFAIPGDLATPTGGYAYDRRIIRELETLGWRVEVVGLGDGFPRPAPAVLETAGKRLCAVSPGLPIVVDGLAYGVMADAAARLRQARPLIALVHHPLALETGLTAAAAANFLHQERAALAVAQAVIATSATTARLLTADYAVPAARIAVVPPGTDPAPLAPGSADGTVRLLAVGAVVPRKGYDLLAAALATLADLPWRLTIAGARDRDPACAARLDADINRLGLAGRVAVVGAVGGDRLADLYRTADLFVLASRFEGYGMAFAEAMAHGLPAIGTTAGAIPETLPAEAAVLVEPGDAEALALALRWLIADAGARRRLAAGARAAAAALPSWRQAGQLFARTIEAVL